MLSLSKPNHTTVETASIKSSSSLSIYLYSISQSTGGIVVLFIFVSLVFSTAILPLGLPLIVGFNSAAAGFAIIERTKESISSVKYQLVFVGIFLGMAGSVLLFFFCPWESPLDLTNLSSAVFSALILIFVGAWIGARSHVSKSFNEN